MELGGELVDISKFVNVQDRVLNPLRTFFTERTQREAAELRDDFVLGHGVCHTAPGMAHLRGDFGTIMELDGYLGGAVTLESRIRSRPLIGHFARYIEDPLSEKILTGEFVRGDEIEVDVAPGKDKLTFRALSGTRA